MFICARESIKLRDACSTQILLVLVYLHWSIITFIGSLHSEFSQFCCIYTVIIHLTRIIKMCKLPMLKSCFMFTEISRIQRRGGTQRWTATGARPRRWSEKPHGFQNQCSHGQYTRTFYLLSQTTKKYYVLFQLSYNFVLQMRITNEASKGKLKW